MSAAVIRRVSKIKARFLEFSTRYKVRPLWRKDVQALSVECISVFFPQVLPDTSRVESVASSSPQVDRDNSRQCRWAHAHSDTQRRHNTNHNTLNTGSWQTASACLFRNLNPKVKKKWVLLFNSLVMSWKPRLRCQFDPAASWTPEVWESVRKYSRRELNYRHGTVRACL